MNYQLTSGVVVIRVEDNAFIPPDPSNGDYREYLDWVGEGNEPLPADNPEPTP